MNKQPPLQIDLSPDQIITINDYPVHSTHVLKMYFRMFQYGAGHIVPPCPVMHESLVVDSFNAETRLLFDDFRKEHRDAKYFLLDGSHKTTAACLAGSPIRAIDIRTNEMVHAMLKLVETGELLGCSLEKTVEANARWIAEDFTKRPGFQTALEKTQRMINEKIIDNYMIDFYLNANPKGQTI